MLQGLEIKVTYRGYVKRSDATGLFISKCTLLNIMSQGTTIEQARAALDDSVRMFVTHCLRRGILENVLRERGLRPVDAESCEHDGLDGHDQESVQIRPVPLLDEWIGEVPLHLIADHLRKSGAPAWQQ